VIFAAFAENVREQSSRTLGLSAMAAVRARWRLRRPHAREFGLRLERLRLL
jgi:hypothetical protein